MAQSLLARAGACAGLLFAALTASGVAQAQTCADENRLRSDRPGVASELTFRNADRSERRIYWLDAEGRRRFYGAVDPGNVYRQPTSQGHIWIVTDEAERCLSVVTAEATPKLVELGGGPVVAAPPPGVLQPVSPGPAAAAPPAPSLDAPPPQSPVVAAAATSPIELFQLAGFYQLTSVADPTKGLNNQENSNPELVRVRPDWQSGHWEFEEVDGTPYVRIRNRWKSTYLSDVGGALRVVGGRADEPETHWALEPVEDAPYARLFNVGSQRYLISIRSGFDMVEEPPRDPNGFWQLSPVLLSPVARQVAVPTAARVATLARIPDPERNRAYEAAVDNCAELGGYWTGSTCRAFRGSRPQSCGRGWVWSEEAGECQWDGGDRRQCPPWMLGTPPNCQAELSCLGGNLRISRNGYQACDCPPGTAMRGAFPNFRCAQAVGSLPVFVVPFLGTFTGNNFNPPPRPVVNPIGPGRDRMCNLGEPARGCFCGAPNAVQNGFCVRPAAARACNVGEPVSSGCTCAAPLTVQNGRCIGSPVVLSCRGGDLVSSGCSCVAPMTVQNGRCIGASSARVCTGGEPVSSGCTCVAPLTVQNGRCVGAASVRACSAGERISSACECVAPLRNDNGVCKTVAAAPVLPPPVANACAPGQSLRSGCTCAPPMQVAQGRGSGGICVTAQAAPEACTPGQALRSGCTCDAPLTRQNGLCVAAATPTTTAVKACSPGQPTSSGCDCAPPMRITRSGNGLVCAAAPAGAVACTPGQALSSGCTCNAPLVGRKGQCVAPGTPIASGLCSPGEDTASGCECRAPMQVTSVRSRPGGGAKLVCQPGTVGAAVCTPGQLLSSGCNCASPLVRVRTRCVAPQQPQQATACTEGQSLNSGCKCNAPLRQLAGNICGKLTIAPPIQAVQCREGQNVSSGCLCGQGLSIQAGGVCGKPKVNTPPPPPTPPKVNQGGGGGGGPPNQRACAVGEKISTGCRCQPPNGVGFSPQGAICKAN
jgi:hypothetical protein